MNFLSLLPFMKRDFLEGREAVKRESEKMVRESLVMCIDVTVNVAEYLVIAARSVSKTEEQVSRVFKKLSETGTFYSADFLSDSGSAPEVVLFSRATHCYGSSTTAP